MKQELMQKMERLCLTFPRLGVGEGDRRTNQQSSDTAVPLKCLC